MMSKIFICGFEGWRRWHNAHVEVKKQLYAWKQEPLPEGLSWQPPNFIIEYTMHIKYRYLWNTIANDQL